MRPFEGVKILDCTHVRELREALQDPQLEHRAVLHRHDKVPGLDKLLTVPLAAFKYAHGGPSLERPPARVGEHTDEVLASVGYSAVEIAALRKSGAAPEDAMQKIEKPCVQVRRIARAVARSLFALAACCNAAEAADATLDGAAAFPARPLRFIAPTSPGGPNDVIARMLGTRMTGNWGQQVVVDARPGASGIVGSQIAARAAPDGYTILIVANGYALNPYLYAKLPYDTLKDFDRVTLFALAPLVLVVHPSVPVQSLPELIALAKAKPGQLNYASSGVGASGWLAFELFRSMARLDLVHVPYKGAGQANAAVLAGEVQMHFTSSFTASPLIKAGRVRALAVTSAKRLGTMEQVPAVAEMLPGYEVLSFFGILVTGGTPKPIIEKLHQEIARITALPDVKSQFAALGLEVVDYGPDKFTAFVKSEMAKWSEVFAERGIKPE